MANKYGWAYVKNLSFAGVPQGPSGSVQYRIGSTTDITGSGELVFESDSNELRLTGSFLVEGNVMPATDNTYDLGSSAKRFANIYTGDLHLKNDRGDWTIIEEEDYLSVVNNNTGKVYKMVLEEIKD